MSIDRLTDSIVSGPIVLFVSVATFLFLLILLFFCCRTKEKSLLFTCNRQDDDKRASIQSYDQLFFTGSSSMNSIEPTIERWTNIEQPKFSFYRVYLPNDDQFYRPVLNKPEQSNANDYRDHEIIFF